MRLTSSELCCTFQAHEQASAITVLCSSSEAAHAGQPGTMLGEHAYTTYLSALKEVGQSSLEEQVPIAHQQQRTNNRTFPRFSFVVNRRATKTGLCTHDYANCRTWQTSAGGRAQRGTTQAFQPLSIPASSTSLCTHAAWTLAALCCPLPAQQQYLLELGPALLG